MNNFEISLHAKEQADEREISVETIFDVLKNPDKVEVEENGQLIYQKVIIENPVKKSELGKNSLPNVKIV